MNYAEDRLDRRARYQEESTSKDGEAEQSPAKTSSASGIVADLLKAHSLLRDVGNSISDAARSNESFSSDAQQIDVLTQLRDAHELAGRSFRDCGQCRHATFHYGQAWLCDPDNYERVGDYAQMADLAGFPEVGIMALLYYRAGGQLEDQLALRMAQEAPIIAEEDNVDVENVLTRDFNDPRHCGCGYGECGSSTCHIAFPFGSALLQQLVKELEGVLDAPSSQVTAADILEGLSKAAQAEKRNRRAAADGSLDHQSSSEPTFMPPQDGIPSNLQFWNATDMSNNTKTQREFPPLLQILLLKLLYSSACGGPFLKLACMSIPHLSLKMPLSSALGRQMARDYKSHWAYYILIRAVVLGERVKKHRRGTAVPYHVPVWDIVHGLDQRGTEVCSDDSDGTERNQSAAFAQRMLQLFMQCESTSSTWNEDAIRLNPACPPMSPQHPPLFILGDSHVLSIAWQTIEIPTTLDHGNVRSYRTLVSYPATGIKAWHCREQTRFFTYYNLQMSIQRLPRHCKTVFLSAGEIDCREGIGGEKLSGYYASCDDAVRNTVREYIMAVVQIAIAFNLQILLLPVAPHAYRSQKNGKAAGRNLRRERMMLWNDLLREECAKDAVSSSRVHLLDYETKLRSPDESSPVGFVLNKAYNADYTHLNSAFLPHLEDALGSCKLDFSLL